MCRPLDQSSAPVIYEGKDMLEVFKLLTRRQQPVFPIPEHTLSVSVTVPACSGIWEHLRPNQRIKV